MRKLLVSVNIDLTEEEQEIRALDIAGGKDEEELPDFRELKGYLHHWGQESNPVMNSEEEVVGVNTITTAIVEEAETGQIHTFHPTQLKILGYTTYR